MSTFLFLMVHFCEYYVQIFVRIKQILVQVIQIDIFMSRLFGVVVHAQGLTLEGFFYVAEEDIRTTIRLTTHLNFFFFSNSFFLFSFVMFESNQITKKAAIASQKTNHIFYLKDIYDYKLIIYHFLSVCICCLLNICLYCTRLND